MSVAHSRKRPLAIAAAVAVLAALIGSAAPARAQTAPEPAAPEIELLTPGPTEGDEVRLRVVSSDPGSGIASFEYGVDLAVAQHSVEADGGEAVIAFTAEAGRRTVYVWAKNHDGVLSDRAEISFFVGRYIAPQPLGAWRLDGDGVDDAGVMGGFDLPDADWEETASPAPIGHALRFDGDDCRSGGDGAAMRTDRAYFVAAWVRLDSKATDQVFVAKPGQHASPFLLGYDSDSDRLTLTVTDRDASDGTSQSATVASDTGPRLGEWTHLLAYVSVDALVLFVDGAREGEAAPGLWPEDFGGAVHLGCGTAAGTTGFEGALTHVGIWQGGPYQRNVESAYRGDFVPAAAAHWRLRGEGGDASEHHRDLTVPGSVEWVADQYGRFDSAARFDGDSCASVDDSVVHSHGDLTVEAWVRLDSKDRDQTFVSQATRHRTSFSLGYDAREDAWRLSVPVGNGTDRAAVVDSTSTPEPGVWTHLVGTVNTERDAPGRLDLYVDGVLEGSAEFDFAPMGGKDSVTVGCASDSVGNRSAHLSGALSDVRLWRGALDEAGAAAAHSGNPELELQGGWWFVFGEYDNSTDHELLFHGTEDVDWWWEDVFENGVWTGLMLSGTGSGYASTADPVLTTDESFTVKVFASLSDKAGDQTVMAQAGEEEPGFELGYDAELDRFHFTMSSADGTRSRAVGDQSPRVGEWYALAAVFDLPAGQVTLYVDGEPVDVVDGPASPWDADGPLTFGLAADASGRTWNPLDGGFSDPRLWSSVLSADRI